MSESGTVMTMEELRRAHPSVARRIDQERGTGQAARNRATAEHIMELARMAAGAVSKAEVEPEPVDPFLAQVDDEVRPEKTLEQLMAEIGD